jgi:hypothetical protein
VYYVAAFPVYLHQADKWMQRAIEILLVLGVLVNLIKGADLLLRPHQQKWLQTKCDTLALWLDYRRPLQWYMRPDIAKKTFWLSATMLIVTGSVLTFVNWGKDGLPFAIIFGVLGVCYTLSKFLNVDKEPEADSQSPPKNRWQAYGTQLEKDLKEWLWRSPSVITLLSRQLLLAIAGLLSQLLAMSILFTLLIALSSSVPSWISLSCAAVFLVAVYYRRPAWALHKAFVDVGGPVAFALVFTILLIIGELILKVLRAFMWRIAEYNKGAFAAIVLIVTIALGVTEFYLKFQPPAPTNPVASTSSSTPQP